MERFRVFLSRNMNVRSVLCLALWTLLPAHASAQSVGGKHALSIAHIFPGYSEAFDKIANGTGLDPPQDPRQSLVVEGQDVSGEAGQPIPLKIVVRQTSDVALESVKLFGLPPGFTLKDSLHTLVSTDSGNLFDLTDWNISDLRIAQREPHGNQLQLSLAFIWKSKSSGSIEVSSTDFAVIFHAKSGSGDGAASGRSAERPNHAEEVRLQSGKTVPPRPPSVDPAPSGPTVLKAEVTSTPAPGRGADVDRERIGAGGPPNAGTQASVPHPPSAPPRRPTDAGPLVERAKDLIRRGDISGARLFLERARARNEPNATFLLAQTWDPEMLRQWNVRGLRPDPERARALYAEAAEQGQTDDRLLAATRR